MPVTNGFLEQIAELLAPLGHVSARKMFGGASLYCDGTIFALVDDDVLYLKADESSKRRYEADGLKPFTYEGQTGPVSMSYWRAPERLFDEPDDMLDWAREALQVAQREAGAKAAKSRKAAADRPAQPKRAKPAKAPGAKPSRKNKTPPR